MKTGTILIPVLMLAAPIPAAADPAADVDAANQKLMEAFDAGDAEAVAALYTEDAAVMPPGSDLARGRDGAQEFWQGAFDAGLTGVDLTTDQLDVQGDTAIETGNYAVTMSDGSSENGKYIVVWHRTPDGAWKMNRDIWNASK